MDITHNGKVCGIDGALLKSRKSSTKPCFNSAGWQHPYVNIFKHVRIEEWKKSAKEGDVSTYMVTFCYTK